MFDWVMNMLLCMATSIVNFRRQTKCLSQYQLRSKHKSLSENKQLSLDTSKKRSPPLFFKLTILAQIKAVFFFNACFVAL